MILEAFILSIIIAFARRGRLHGLSVIPLRKWYLFILPFALSAVVVAAGQIGNPEPRLLYIKIANVVQYILLLSAIAVNLHIREMWMIGVGTLCNALVVAANSGMMPVSAKALELAGMGYLLDPGQFDWNIRHVLMTVSTRLGFLADIIPVPGIGKIMPEVASIGDMLLAIGVFIIVQRYMRRPIPVTKEIESIA